MGIVLCFVPLILAIVIFSTAFKLRLTHQLIAVLLGLAAVLPISFIQYFMPAIPGLPLSPVVRALLKSILLYGLVEEAIKELYFKMINTTQDGDVVDRVNRLVNDQENVKIENLQRKVDRILYLAVKNDFGNKLVYRSPSIIPPPPDMDDAIEIIVDEESGWDNALEEYLMSAMKNDDPGENE